LVRVTVSALTLWYTFSSLVGAADPPLPDSAAAGILPGHSYHGESFDAGPRQAARLIGGTGDVNFPITSKHPEAQASFNQGVGQLHGFWYFEAERSFRHVANLDPDCAIAYWGMAMANVNNASRAKGFIAKAHERRDKASPREQMYIDGLKAFWDKQDDKGKDADKDRRKALVKSYEKIIDAHPDDLEAKALLINQIWDNHGDGLPITAYFPIDALLKEIFAANPNHPSHHYRIHLWDYEKPERALEAAAECGPSAPMIAHMWHMPGHIYSRLKRYPDACWQQEASARVDHAYMMRDRILPDQIHNYAHNNEWLVRDLVAVGRMTDALEMSKGLIANPQHPKFNNIGNSGSFKFGRQRLCDTLSDFEMWDEAIRVANSTILEPTMNEDEQVRRLRLIGRAEFRRGNFTPGCAVLTELLTRRTAIQTEQQAAIAKAEEDARKDSKKDDQIKEARDKAKNSFNGRLNPYDPAINELSGYVHLADRAYEDALASFKGAGRFDTGFLADVQLKAGKTDDALESVRREVRSEENEVLPLARLVETLWKAGKKDDAKTELEKLRDLATGFDPAAPIYSRISKIATDLSLPAEWRKPFASATDVGQRPPLDSLGPFVWSPSPALPWTLLDPSSQPKSSTELTGQPYVVIFSLGLSCLHCNEQLKAFATAQQKFADPGLKVVAISTDPVSDTIVTLKTWQKDAGDSGAQLPLILLSDSAKDVFKAYRCFDDFENLPLHGTFLIDAAGLVRWQDIGPEPFMDVDFLVAESRRLLSLPLAAARPTFSQPPPPPMATLLITDDSVASMK
jgi:peroxiredoxin/tetratricopeptide (TPR) repeat protein